MTGTRNTPMMQFRGNPATIKQKFAETALSIMAFPQGPAITQAKGMLGKEVRRIMKLLDTRAVGKMDNVTRGDLVHGSVCSSAGKSVAVVNVEEAEFEEQHVFVDEKTLEYESKMDSVSEETVIAPVDDIGSEMVVMVPLKSCDETDDDDSHGEERSKMEEQSAEDCGGESATVASSIGNKGLVCREVNVSDILGTLKPLVNCKLAIECITENTKEPSHRKTFTLGEV